MIDVDTVGTLDRTLAKCARWHVQAHRRCSHSDTQRQSVREPASATRRITGTNVLAPVALSADVDAIAGCTLRGHNHVTLVGFAAQPQSSYLLPLQNVVVVVPDLLSVVM